MFVVKGILIPFHLARRLAQPEHFSMEVPATLSMRRATGDATECTRSPSPTPEERDGAPG